MRSLASGAAPERRDATRATLVGFGAILLWSLLALFTAASGAVPPFQLAAMTFLIGGALGCTVFLAQPERLRALRQPWRVWCLGVGGLFAYHALYFVALRFAPPAEAGLISYLWPLLIVLFSAWLPGSRGLRAGHLVGAGMGLGGVVILFAGRDLNFSASAGWGYLAALAAAFVWAGYSVLSARVAAVPTDAVAGFCLATGVLSLLCHLAFETTVWPADTVNWGAIVLLGLGPVGAAFYLWDIGCKKGDVRVLGVAAYAAPMLSTLVLVVAGYAEARPALALSCALIVAGALSAVYASRQA
ncbi:aromatic amino acid exporter YddG [Methylobacterium aerolatum]|uniref:Drug/metabolite transporter (DMT)-like permease n=1 Tax=Methylobacterium aerolatum TaxID=418708 RepID=A0ABU0HUP5_9HYPH|nr:EamA family transporter [Methylobacterium aerolatum]MDQ0445632.1 drug/metabolite transporter (DMT)-like permease [Methylobacterium aerolatum]GJD36259.1 Methyl viologen resistance protein YddG [Methylobacterium aerolatum]